MVSWRPSAFYWAPTVLNADAAMETRPASARNLLPLKCPKMCPGTCDRGPTIRRSHLNGCGVRHIGVRRRLRNLPFVGELLAAADKRTCDLPSLPRSCRRRPYDS